MPELPEVETIASYLRTGRQEAPSILDCEIIRVDLLWSKTLAEPGQAEFTQRLLGQVVTEISRRGKYLILKLKHDWLLIHLRMSGDIYMEEENVPPLPHDRLRLHLDNGYRLTFNDARKFGRVWLVSDPITVLGNLGPEPLERSLTADKLYHLLHHTRRQIKPLLLDQTFVAGMGNIYTDEALHLARLHPTLPANLISMSETNTLLKSIRTVLKEGIKRQGASIDWVYRGGDFQNYFRVYQRTGLPCPQCGTTIERMLVAQRGTHFCPRCQSLPNAQHTSD